MKTFRRLALGLALLFLAGSAARAKPLSDLISPEKRRQSVDLGNRLTTPVDPSPLPGDLTLPFSPPGFEQADSEERAAIQAGARTNAMKQAAADAKAVAERPVTQTEHDLLESIAANIVPSGTIVLRNEPLLTFGKKFVRIGAHFTVTYQGGDYDLELTAVTATTFTLRLNREEITRPISSKGKSP